MPEEHSWKMEVKPRYLITNFTDKSENVVLDITAIQFRAKRSFKCHFYLLCD